MSIKVSERSRLPLAVATAFFVVLITVGASYSLSLYAVHKATNNTASVQELCFSANENRTEQITLWTFLVNMNSSHRSAVQKREVDNFLKYVHKVFRLRNCSNISRK
jgi:hypothetical protein